MKEALPEKVVKPSWRKVYVLEHPMQPRIFFEIHVCCGWCAEIWNKRYPIPQYPGKMQCPKCGYHNMLPEI